MEINPAARGAKPPPAAPRTGAFADVRALWLLLWAFAGLVAFAGIAVALFDYGVEPSEDLGGILFYVPAICWLVFVVVVRRVNLRAMLRWPRLGWYWSVVAGLLALQFLFSLAAIMLTELVMPWLAGSVEDVGQGSLILGVVGLVVLPSLVEEVVFRGVLLERLTVLWRVGLAVIVSSVIFGILHADPVGAGMFGVITALLYLRTGSLWPGIIIHALNNGVVLAATRLIETPEEAPEATVSETLMTAGVLLAVSVPFLVWFIMRTWPARGAATPYQRYELAAGLPERSVPWVWWSAARELMTLHVTNSQAVLAGRDGSAIAVLPLERVAAAYPSPTPGGVAVVVLLRDGTWTTMQVAAGAQKANARLAQTISDRALVAHGRLRGQDAAGPRWPGTPALQPNPPLALGQAEPAGPAGTDAARPS